MSGRRVDGIQRKPWVGSDKCTGQPGGRLLSPPPRSALPEVLRIGSGRFRQAAQRRESAFLVNVEEVHGHEDS